MDNPADYPVDEEYAQVDDEEYFEDSAPSGSKKFVRGLLLLIVFVAIGFLVYYFVLRKKTTLVFYLVTTTGTVPSAAPGPVNITSSSATLFGYFNVSGATFSLASGSATYNTDIVATIASSSDYTTDSKGNYWFPISLTQFASQNIAAGKVSLSVKDSSGNSQTAVSSNTLEISLGPYPIDSYNDNNQVTAIFTAPQQPNNLTDTSSNRIYDFFESNLVSSTNSLSGSFSMTPAVSFGAGSNYSGFTFVLGNMCESPVNAGYPLKLTTTAGKCWNGSLNASVLSAASCVAYLFITFASYSNGTGPFLASSQGTYNFAIDDNSKC